MTAATGAGHLDAVRMPGDRLDVDADGMLAIGGRRADALLAAHGSPLFVVVEDTLRANYRAIRDAFAARWPAPINVMYSIKANNTLAIRAILSTEGAGGDCFGLGELHATLAGGADPRRVVMNGSDKTQAEIDAAVNCGITINVDGDDEPEYLRSACRRWGKRARVNLRLKVLPADLDPHVSELHRTDRGFVAGVARSKWGYTVAAARPRIEALQRIDGVDLAGYSCHIGHLSKAPAAFAAVAGAFGQAVAALAADTGFHPRVLNLGGGWAPTRDPSFRAEEPHPHTIDDYAEATVTALARTLPAGMAPPELWLEPGRYIVANAVVLLATVGAVKRDAGYRWLHVDASTNLLPRIESGRFHYTLLPASRMHAPASTPAEIVGSTCFRSVLGAGRAMPYLARGDVIAILDAGMYAEAFANQFNGVPRPAAVLVSAHGVDTIRERETITDVFRQHRIPAWLAAAAPATPADGRFGHEDRQA